MSTTTIRIDPKLKQRIARVAKQTGTSAHSLMVGAIEEVVARTEKRAAFLEEAEARSAEFDRTGRGVPWTEVSDWLEARLVRGEKVEMPRARRLRKPAATR